MIIDPAWWIRLPLVLLCISIIWHLLGRTNWHPRVRVPAGLVLSIVVILGSWHPIWKGITEDFSSTPKQTNDSASSLSGPSKPASPPRQTKKQASQEVAPQPSPDDRHKSQRSVSSRSANNAIAARSRQNSSVETSPEIKPILVGCSSGFMPTLNITPNDRVHVLELGAPPAVSTLSEMFLNAGGKFTIKVADNVPASAWMCKVTNYENTPIINATLIAHMKWWKTSTEGITTRVGDFNANSDVALLLDKIDVGKDNPYIFYVVNFTSGFVRLSFGDVGSGTRLDTNTAVKIPIRSTTPKMEIWPQPSYGKH